MTELRAVYNVPGKPEPKEWKCSCGFVFGYVEDGHLHLEIANGEYAIVKGFAFAPCRRCGRVRIWRQEEK